MSEFPTPIHELPANIGGRFVVLVVVCMAILLGLLALFDPGFLTGSSKGYGTLIFVGSISIVLAIIVNSVWDRLTDKAEESED